jgi:hypothetical protein
METTTDLKPFGFTFKAWHTVEDKIDIWTIQDELNTQLNLSKYGDGLYQIQFEYIADDWEKHQEQMTFNPETKILFLSLRLDFETIKTATKAEVLTMMKELFLSSVFYYFGVRIYDFDYRMYYEDLKEIFEV